MRAVLALPSLSAERGTCHATGCGGSDVFQRPVASATACTVAAGWDLEDARPIAKNLSETTSENHKQWQNCWSLLGYVPQREDDSGARLGARAPHGGGLAVLQHAPCDSTLVLESEQSN